MSAYVKVLHTTPPTIVEFDEDRTDGGFAILRFLEQRYPGPRLLERDARWDAGRADRERRAREVSR